MVTYVAICEWSRMAILVIEGGSPNGMDLVVGESRYVDVQAAIKGPSKRYRLTKFVANDGGDRIVVRAYVAADGSVLDRDGGRPTVKVIKRSLNLMTMELE